jgi:hypothetical protein
MTLVPLGIIAFELGLGTRDLERRCNGAVTRDPYGIRCIPGDLVRELIAERDAKLDARRAEHQRHQDALAAQGNPIRERVRAIQATQRPVEGNDMAAMALAVVMSDHYTQRLDEAGERWDSYRQQEMGG